MKNQKKIRNVAVGAVVAALYVVLTYLANMLGLASGAIQVRLSEILTVMPVFTPFAIPGLFIGCVLANILTGCALWDVVFGSLATLVGAVGTYLLRKNNLLAVVPPILSNAIIVPFVLLNVYALEGTYFYFFATVIIGEIISCGVFGTFLLKSLKKYDKFL
ncbi:MAG: QueT transporter family protein [Clostridia bacterium]|nr:QueT transporter family protein [Clostridia bacterium]